MKKIADLRGHTSRVLHLALSPDGTTVASAAADETLRFWKVFQPSSHSSALSKLQNISRIPKKPSQSILIEETNPMDAQSSPDMLMQDCSRFIQASPS